MNGKVSGDCATSRFPFNESTQHSDGEGSSEGIVWLWWPGASRLGVFASPSQGQSGRLSINHRSPLQSEPHERNAEMRTFLETLLDFGTQ